jgi:hypothetical protein
MLVQATDLNDNDVIDVLIGTATDYTEFELSFALNQSQHSSTMPGSNSSSAQQAMMSSFRVQVASGLPASAVALDAPARRADGSLKDAEELEREGQFLDSPSDEHPNPLERTSVPNKHDSTLNDAKKRKSSALESGAKRRKDNTKPAQPIDRVTALKEIGGCSAMDVDVIQLLIR